MANIYEKATQILGNLKLSSDNVDMYDCYHLCANKHQIEEMKVKAHQVIWGRRGTGKTTLLKAFVHNINYLQQDPSTVAIYIVMAKIIPTEDEISVLTGDGSGLAIYVFSKLIDEICKEFEKIYNSRYLVMEGTAEKQFLESFYELQDYLKTYQTYIQGGELTIDNLKSNEVKKEIGYGIDAGINGSTGILGACINFFKKHNKTFNNKQTLALTGKVAFKLETRIIGNLITKMLDAFNISLTYICLDEYSEMDKISEYTIQSKVAQLIKQIFFKNPRYSVKIATIWNRSKLHTRGGNRVEGIEYQQDIFAGPDLDIMFMENNIDVINYFKEVLVNTYLMDEEITLEERKALSDYFETDIFGKTGLRHLICGSQGISRTFVVLVKAYLQRFIKNREGPIKLATVYEIIKHQYLEDVRNKIPYYSLYKEIDKFITEKQCRYFLISREDYGRCKSLIKYLATRGLFVQLPGHLTNRVLRDEYKLFIIHYGSYLDALESASYRTGRKKLDEDAKLEANGMLLPEYDPELINTPESYTVSIPANIENEVYCTCCEKIFISDKKGDKVQCTHCGHETLQFAEFVDEVAI